MGPPVDGVPSQDTLPEAADVVIVGGGIIGASAALFLARQGVSTVLCEKGHVAGEQSSRNWGWCRRMGRDERELPLIMESLRLWDRMDELVGEDVGFRRSGILYLCENDAAVAEREAWLRRAGPYGLDSRIVRGAELQALLPGAAKPLHAALYTPSDGRAEPQKAAPAIARAATRAGARLVDNCAVRAVETTGGRVSGVVTEKGTIRCGAVLVAGGAWSGLLCRTLGLRLPQLLVRSSVMRTGPVEGGPEAAAAGAHFAFRKRQDGGYTVAGGNHRHDIVPDSFRYFLDYLPILKLEWRGLDLGFGAEFFRAPRISKNDGASPFEATRTLDPSPIYRHSDKALAALKRTFPAFRDVQIIQRWAGMIDAMPDAVPVISTVQSVPGLVLATGFSGHGFGLGPAAGRLAADIVRGDAPIVDPSPFRYERFIDGTRAKPTTGV
jgi:glycine/D-amino acid oxidase-like deaminating enzyme